MSFHTLASPLVGLGEQMFVTPLILFEYGVDFFLIFFSDVHWLGIVVEMFVVCLLALSGDDALCRSEVYVEAWSLMVDDE